MTQAMNVLAVIPARGGSKGIPKKNIHPLAGKPLLEYTIEAAIESKVCNDIVVSTDADDIAAVARQYNEVTVINRPEEISGDRASTESALIHALHAMEEKRNIRYDAIMTLQPVSPLRTPATVRSFVESFCEHLDTNDAQLTVHEDRTDFWVFDDDNSFHRLYPNAPRRRQERKPLYAEDSCIYICKRDSLLSTGSVLGNSPYGFIITPDEGVDINEPNDLLIAEILLANVERKMG